MLRRLRFVGVLAATIPAAASATYYLFGDPLQHVKTPFYGREGVDAERCQELILRTDGLPAGRILKWEWRGAEEAEGNFYNFKIYLCHTARANLGANFAENYEGRTPTLVFSAAQLTLTMPAQNWFGWDFTQPFDYNGSDNLICEVWWEGDDDRGGETWATDVPGQERCVMSRVVNGNPQNGYPNAGAVSNRLHYMRVTISELTAEPTSLGRLKVVFR